jgi:hypothetical protein
MCPSRTCQAQSQESGPAARRRARGAVLRTAYGTGILRAPRRAADGRVASPTAAAVWVGALALVSYWRVHRAGSCGCATLGARLDTNTGAAGESS